MLIRTLLGALATLALLPGSLGLVQAEDGGVPMIVVFHQQTNFDAFTGEYQEDERVRRDPQAWNYLDHRVLGAVQALETTLGFRARHVYSAALRGFAAELTTQQI